MLALAGDDHGCQSSTLAHQSEQVYAAAMMPILNPATVQEYLDFGLYGFALSRFSGCWIGFKAISEAVESSASVEVASDRVKIVLPTDFEPPASGLHIRWPDPPLDAEARLHGPKMRAVAAFARANPLDRIVLDSTPARLGIMTTGKAYLDVRQALSDLGITDAAGRIAGIVTDGDLRRHMRPDLMTAVVDDVMTRSPKTIGRDLLAVEALEMLNAAKITAVIVTDAGLPVGIVHLHDLLRAGVA